MDWYNKFKLRENSKQNIEQSLDDNLKQIIENLPDDLWIREEEPKKNQNGGIERRFSLMHKEVDEKGNEISIPLSYDEPGINLPIRGGLLRYDVSHK